jgi:chaperonin GroEL (HSP60 family)
MLVMACKMQEEEYGDGTNFTVTFAGELLSHA